MTVATSSSARRLSSVVLPALSRPSTRMRACAGRVQDAMRAHGMRPHGPMKPSLHTHHTQPAACCQRRGAACRKPAHLAPIPAQLAQQRQQALHVCAQRERERAGTAAGHELRAGQADGSAGYGWWGVPLTMGFCQRLTIAAAAAAPRTAPHESMLWPASQCSCVRERPGGGAGMQAAVNGAGGVLWGSAGGYGVVQVDEA